MLSSLLGSVEELLSLFWTSLLEREVANLAIEEGLEVIPVRCFGVELEWVLALLCKTWVEAPQVPVATFNGLCLFCLALAHAALGLETVVDTWSVSDNERWTRVCLCLANCLETLCIWDMDQGQIFVAFATQAQSLNTGGGIYFNPDDESILAYGDAGFEKGQSYGEGGELKELVIPIKWNEKARSAKPTHIIIVCSASKYGDYFVGGTGSIMYVDDFELVYNK